MIEKIVWANYGSSLFDDSLESVKFLAKKFDSEIICLYVKPTSYYEGLEYMPAEESSMFKEWVNQISEAKIQEVKKSSDSLRENGIKSNLEIRRGIPHQEIIDFSRNEKADLITVGKGKLAEPQPYISRTTLKLLRQCEIPVLVSNNSFSEGINNILVPTDLFDIDSTDFVYSLSFSEYFKGLKIFHLNVMGTGAMNLPAEVVAKLRGDTYSKIAIFDDKYENVETRVIEALTPWSGIAEFTEENGIDLIVMNTYSGKVGKRKDFLGSIAERVVQTVKCPVIVVKP